MQIIELLTSDGDGTATAESKLTFDGTTLIIGFKTNVDLSTNDVIFECKSDSQS